VIVAIVGSRPPVFGAAEWMIRARKAVRRIVAELPAGTIIISGGARGIDTLAAEYGRRYGFEVRIYPAEWAKHGRGAGMIRNAQMVDDADQIIAFWDGESRGTRNTIERAERAGKRAWMIPVPLAPQTIEAAGVVVPGGGVSPPRPGE
jgi:hypothetical protein